MRILSSLFFLGLLSTAIALADTPDLRISMTTTLTVEPDRGESYRVFAKVVTKQTYLTQRSTTFTRFPVISSYFTEVSDIRVWHGDDEMRSGTWELEKEENADAFISSAQIVSIKLPKNVAIGDNVTYSFREEYKEPAFLPMLPIPNYGQVEEFKVVVNHPEDFVVRFDFFFPRDPLKYRVEKESDERTTLTFSNIELAPKLSNFPFNDMNGAVQILLQHKGTEVNPNDMRGFVRWYRGLFDQTPKLDAPHDTLLRARIDAVKGDLEKLRIIHDHVRQEIRYIADADTIHAIVPRSPSLVLQRSYGDCKDRAFLVQALARRHGIKVDMALLSTVPRPRFRSPYVTEFNHMICVYRSGKNYIFFDPTHKYCEFGNVPESDIGAEALILDADSPTRMVIEPPNADNSLDVRITGSLLNLKECTATVTLRNGAFHAGAEALDKERDLDRENILSNLVTMYFNKISFDDFELISSNDTSATFSAIADLSDFIIESQEKRYIPQAPFRMMSSEILERAKDSLPIYELGRATIGTEIVLQTTGYAAAPTKLEIDGGAPVHFSASIDAGASDTVRVAYNLAHPRPRIEGDAKTRYLEFCRTYMKNKRSLFTLSRKPQ